MFTVIETADVEIISVSLFHSEAKAVEHFEACASENECQEYSQDDLVNEINGTIRLAGDDSYVVQPIEVLPSDN